MQFTIKRHNATALAFSGSLLAEESTFTDGATHWTEVRIYATDSGKYVTETVGKSAIEGQHDIIHVYARDNAGDAVVSLQRKDRRTGVSYFTDTALDAIATAAETDNAFDPFIVEDGDFANFNLVETI